MTTLKKIALVSVAVLSTASYGAVTNVSLSGGVLTVTCDDANDTVMFQQWGGTAGQPATYNTRIGTSPNLNNFDLLRTWSGLNGVPVNGNGIIYGVQKIVILGGAGNDNLSVYHGTSAGTQIEIFGEAGDDILSGGHNTDDLLIGGAGNDSIYGLNGQDRIYGDDFGVIKPEQVTASSRWTAATTPALLSMRRSTSACGACRNRSAMRAGSR